jgi:hypothetical protein
MPGLINNDNSHVLEDIKKDRLIKRNRKGETVTRKKMTKAFHPATDMKEERH